MRCRVLLAAAIRCKLRARFRAAWLLLLLLLLLTLEQSTASQGDCCSNWLLL
jgi:hypothetical protein